MPYLTEESLAKFTLVPATEAQIIVCRKRQAEQWARGMTEDEFIWRENQLEILEHASDGKFNVWVLVPRDDPETLNYPCSCETLRRKVLVSNAFNTLEETVGYGIASVFCGSEYRKQGYTSHMMRLLHHILASPGSLATFPEKWGSPPPYYEGVGNARCSVLYSDVGDFYSRCGPMPLIPGWEIRSPVSTTWKPDLISGLVQDSGKIEFLSEAQCKVLWDNDAKYITEQLSRLPASSHTRFTFLPNEGLGSFLLRRALSEVPLLPKVPMEHWGVQLVQNDGSSESPIYATWTLDMQRYKPPVMVVTRLRATSESFPALLSALSIEASRISAITIEVWNLETGLADVAANTGGRTVMRTEHLPAVAWYGPERQQEVEWVFNEKFPWC